MARGGVGWQEMAGVGQSTSEGWQEMAEVEG